MSHTAIYADDRELRAHGAEPDRLRTRPFALRRLDVGDYVIGPVEGRIAVFERKTAADFAASLKDGRADNFEKMIAYRKSAPEREECAEVFLGLILEGPRDTGGGVPWDCVESKIYHLAIRDNIHHFATSGPKATLDFLESFARSMSSLRGRQRATPSAASTLTAPAAAPSAPRVAGGAPVADQEAAGIAVDMLRRIPHTSAPVARKILAGGATVREIILGTSLQPLAESATQRIKEAPEGPAHVVERMIFCVPGIGPDRRSALVAAAESEKKDIAAFIAAGPIDDIALGGRRLGKPGRLLWAALNYHP